MDAAVIAGARGSLNRKGALRLDLGPKHTYLPGVIAKEVVAAFRLSKWRISKEPPNPPHSTPGE